MELLHGILTLTDLRENSPAVDSLLSLAAGDELVLTGEAELDDLPSFIDSMEAEKEKTSLGMVLLPDLTFQIERAVGRQEEAGESEEEAGESEEEAGESEEEAGESEEEAYGE